MAYVPFTGVSEEYKKEAEQEGKGFISRAKEDIYSTGDRADRNDDREHHLDCGK